jgi:hypothetical protein
MTHHRGKKSSKKPEPGPYAVGGWDVKPEGTPPGGGTGGAPYGGISGAPAGTGIPGVEGYEPWKKPEEKKTRKR